MGALLSIPLLAVPSMGTVSLLPVLPLPKSAQQPPGQLLTFLVHRSLPSQQAVAELPLAQQYAALVVNAEIGQS